jgi:hypothetical protein
MSAQHSPPLASINMAWTKTFAAVVEWQPSVDGHDACRELITQTETIGEGSQSVQSDMAQTWSPPASTFTRAVLLPFISEVPSRLGCWVFATPVSLARGHFC